MRSLFYSGRHRRPAQILYILLALVYGPGKF